MKNLSYYKETLNKRVWLFLVILLLFDFIIRVVIYYNTTLFYFSDFRSYLNGIEMIKKHGTIPLFGGTYSYLNSYLGYFFKYILGSIDYYFIFNCLLGTLTSLVSFLIIREITPNRLAALLAVLFQSVYIEFLAFSSIFYTPIIMIFILNVLILLIIYFSKTSSLKKIIFFVGIIVFLILLSFYFKFELKYFWALLLMVGLFSYIKNKDKKFAIKFIALGIIIFIFQNLSSASGLYTGPEGTNMFVFFGHTSYGGMGGEGAFIYPENRKKYDLEFKKFMNKNHIQNPTRSDHNRFRSQEIRKFIFNHPFKWVKLQFYKLFRTFGIIPEGNSFKILMSGTTSGNWILTSILLVLPIIFLIILFLLLFDFSDFKKILNNNLLIFLALSGFYYILGSVFYGHFQERYRMPFVVTFLIPYVAYKLADFKFSKLTKNKVIVKIILVLIALGIWGSQAYEVLVLQRDRYFGVVDKLSDQGYTDSKKINFNN